MLESAEISRDRVGLAGLFCVGVLNVFSKLIDFRPNSSVLRIGFLFGLVGVGSSPILSRSVFEPNNLALYEAFSFLLLAFKQPIRAKYFGPI